jgi:CHAD domain-containing protein
MVPIPDFRLLPEEPLGEGLQRLGMAEIESAVSRFYDGEDQFGLAVHEARKSIKKLRSLLRLVKGEIGERAFKYENTALRETGRVLSPIRSAAMVAAGVHDIRSAYSPLLKKGTFHELAHRLSVRRDDIEERAMSDPNLLPTVIANLERAHSRYASWPTDPEARSVYGIGIRNSYEAIRQGLSHTYAAGRREMVAAYTSPSPGRFHQWRKRAKYFRHQLEILTPLWPEVILGMAYTLERVGELLGEDHDLAEMLNLVADRPDLCPNPIERSLLNALAEQRRSDLETACRILGRKVYAETPESLDVRFAAYWDSAEMARRARFIPPAG